MARNFRKSQTNYILKPVVSGNIFTVKIGLDFTCKERVLQKIDEVCAYLFTK